MSGNEAEENIISKFKGTSETSLALNAKLAPKGQAGYEARQEQVDRG